MAGVRVPVHRVSAQRGFLYLIKGCGSIEFQERRVIVIADATTLDNVFPAVLWMSGDEHSLQTCPHDDF